ncbi:MAG TPA: PQQ-dependent sugar dehydrogenase [Solirubrobacterales bacterium]|nr:PQQ-dependent sugar dehydrogenase [Solirubrobacterales bacterium]
MAAIAPGCGGADEGPATTSAPRPAPEADGGGQAGPAVGDGKGGTRLVEVGRFEEPVFVAQPPGERDDLYVVEKAGRVVLVHDGEARAEPFLDLRDEVSTGLEQGLLSIAFAPDYSGSGRFYVDFTDTGGDTQVQEFRRSRSDPSVADPATRRELLSVEQPFPNHNGGLLLFGPDDDLYIGLGDGGGEGDPMRNGQSLDTLLGKLLRIDPRPSNGAPYTIPASNPFADEPGARPEIYAYGLRNPWRFSFDRLTAALSIGDVGQDALEEVDLVRRGAAAGANFGWSAFEGGQRFNHDQHALDSVPPVLDYPLDGPACAVTGGYVVRDASLRSLYGRYLYADFCVGELRSFTARPGRAATDDRALGPEVPNLSSFGEDDRGRIYVVSLDGPVYRLAPAR